MGRDVGGPENRRLPSSERDLLRLGSAILQDKRCDGLRQTSCCQSSGALTKANITLPRRSFRWLKSSLAFRPPFVVQFEFQEFSFGQAHSSSPAGVILFLK